MLQSHFSDKSLPPRCFNRPFGLHLRFFSPSFFAMKSQSYFLYMQGGSTPERRILLPSNPGILGAIQQMTWTHIIEKPGLKARTSFALQNRNLESKVMAALG